MRRRTNLDPLVAADLEALDAHLEGQRPDPDLALIADEVRSGAPRMSPAFAARLEEAVAGGFAGPEPAPRTKRSWRPPLLPAIGVATPLLVVLVVALNSGGAGNRLGDNGASSPAGAGPSASQSASGGGGTAIEQQSAAKSAPSAAAALPSASGTAAGPAGAERAAPSRDAAIGQDSSTVVPPPGAGPRRVQRAADLTISTPIGKLQDTSDAVTGVADRLGGYVYDSSVSANGDNGQATFDLRVPTTRLDEAMAALSRLGHVRSRTETSQDITARFSSALSRLTDARAERQGLLRALAAAATTQEIDSIKQRLAIANNRIIAAKSDLFAARRASNLARVTVTVLGVAGDQGGAGGGSDDPWTPGKALGDAVDVLSAVAGALIVGLAGGIPAAIVALLLYLAWRAHRRRRRELALDTASAAV